MSFVGGADGAWFPESDIGGVDIGVLIGIPVDDPAEACCSDFSFKSRTATELVSLFIA